MPPYIYISVGGKAPRSMVPVPVSHSPISILDGGTAISVGPNNSLTNDLDKAKIHLDMLIYAHQSDNKKLMERARDRFLRTQGGSQDPGPVRGVAHISSALYECRYLRA